MVKSMNDRYSVFTSLTYLLKLIDDMTAMCSIEMDGLNGSNLIMHPYSVSFYVNVCLSTLLWNRGLFVHQTVLSRWDMIDCRLWLYNDYSPHLISLCFWYSKPLIDVESGPLCSDNSQLATHEWKLVRHSNRFYGASDSPDLFFFRALPPKLY